jgi:hypothetical protein
MRAKEFLRLITEKMANPGQSVPGDPKLDPLYGLKLAIASKIKDLPDTPEVKDQLEDIDDALKHLDTGKKRRGAAEDELGTWSDEDVKEAKSMLARYIVSMNAPMTAKLSMLELWKAQGLINVKAITAPNGIVPISKVVKGYTKNPAIKEMADDLLKVDSMGVGKGEFMLRVMSPQITKPDTGDLLVKGLGKLEVKTNNQNAARMYDRNVKPTEKYAGLAEAFRQKYEQYWMPSEQTPMQTPVPTNNINQTQQQPVQQTQQQQPAQQNLNPIQPQGTLEHRGKAKGPVRAKAPVEKKTKGFSKTGINLPQIVELYKKVPRELQNTYLSDLHNLVNEIFPAKRDIVPNIVSAVRSGNAGQAFQSWAQAAVLNYMAQKDYIGILFINIATDPASFTFFDSVDSLRQAGLRLHAKTPYVISGGIENLYPPTLVVTTTQTS